jgi:hypothetical protein
MPLLFLPDASVQFWANYSLGLNAATINNFGFGLYVSNYTPVAADTLSTYTAIEASTGGYTRQVWVPGVWTGGIVTHQAVYVAPAVTFTFSAAASGLVIYGIFLAIEDNTSTFYLGGASLFGSPLTVVVTGSVFTFTPTFLEYSA